MSNALSPAAIVHSGDRTRIGRLVAVFAVTQTVGYGVLYYAFSVLLTPIAADLHTSTAHVTLALTISVLVAAVAAIPVGRWLDRHGGRSLMTAGSLLGASAGSQPVHQINPVAVEAMKEAGVDITDQRPKILTAEDSEASTVVITMGCGDVCPYYPGQTHLDWELDDPAGQDIDAVRPIRDEIHRRVQALVSELLLRDQA